jgi:hypothetical protein
MKEFSKVLLDMVERHTYLFSIVAAVFFLGIDLLTGKDIEFPLLFAIPTALAAWQLKTRLAYSLAIALPLMRVGFVYFLWEKFRIDFHVLINTLINVLALALYTYLIIQTSVQRRCLEEKVKSLEEELSCR